MPAFTSYLLTMSVVFIVWGAIWYNLDRAYGVRFRRFWYGLTHEKPLPDGEGRGFIYRRDTKTRFTWATILSTVQSVLVVIYASSIDPLTELAAWGLEVPLMLIGMYLGAPLGNLWAGKDQLFEKIDRWEQGESDAVTLDVVPEPRPPQPRPEPEPEPDPQELMERFTRRHGS